VGPRIAPARKVIAVAAACGFALAGVVAALAPEIGGQMVRATAAEAPANKLWQAVAPGRVEAQSGEIRIVAPVIGRIGEVLVKINDKVFAGEPLIRLADDETQARLLAAQAQVALRRRERNDQHPSRGAAGRRQAEDAVADGEQGVVDAWSALDRAVAARRDDKGAETVIDTARARVTSAQDRLKQLKADLRRLETDFGAPLPSRTEGELNIARAELLRAEAAV
jgi:HlyD family secretion protein